MTLINKTQPSLSGGISQQAPTMRLSAQCEDQLNYKASLVNGLQSRPPVSYKGAGGPAASAFYAADRDDTYRYNLFVSPSGLSLYDTDGVEQSITYSSGWQTYLAASVGCDPYKTYKVLTLADHTFILNTEKQTALTSEQYTAWRNQALIFIKQVNYTTTWTLTINGVTLSVGLGGSEPDGSNPKLYINGTTQEVKGELSSSFIASKLAEISVSGFTITQVASTLWIRRTDGAAFTIGVADSRSDSCITLVTSKVQQFDQLPTVAPDGYICRVVGAVSSSADDYYVIFNCNSDTTFGKGAWEECAEPGAYCALDPASMPWKLVHTFGTSWTFGPATWAEKLTGDLDSSPIPQFIGKKLNNIFLFMNRLCFLAEDLLCMSRAADYTDFWNETAIALSDADPIFLSASTEYYAELFDFAVLDDDLILFSGRDQYRLSSGDVLSPKTAAIKSVANNAYTNGTGIVAAGTRLYFGYKSGEWYSAYEFGTSSITGNKEATPITSHVPNLITFGTRLFITGSENVDTLCVISDNQPDSIYVYQYYISGASKLQAAWYRYNIEGCAIKGAFFRENVLWLHVIKNNQSVIATLDMAEHIQKVIPELSLDFQTTLTAQTATTQYTLPAYINPLNAVIIGRTNTNVPTDINITAISGQTVTLEKAATSIIAGEKYTRSYTFSTLYPSTRRSDGTEKIHTAGRWQLQQLRLNYSISGPYEIHVRPTYDNTAEGYKYLFSGIVAGMQSAIINTLPMSEGCFIVPLRGRNTDLKITIQSESWLPETFTSAEWQGNYITKVRSI